MHRLTAWQHRVVRYRANPALARERAAARISAYVYGNILVFATMVPLGAGDLHHGHAALLVLGVAASTYVAHVFADMVGHHVRTDHADSGAGLRHELRDAMPIVSSAIVPAILFLAGGMGWLPEQAAQLSAEIYLLARMAMVGLLVERLRSAERSSVRTVLSGVFLAAVAAAVSLFKVVIGH